MLRFGLQTLTRLLFFPGPVLSLSFFLYCRFFLPIWKTHIQTQILNVTACLPDPRSVNSVSSPPLPLTVLFIYLWVQRDPWAMPFMNYFIRLKSQRCLPAYWGLVSLYLSKISAKLEIDRRGNLRYIRLSFKYNGLLIFQMVILQSIWQQNNKISTWTFDK